MKHPVVILSALLLTCCALPAQRMGIRTFNIEDGMVNNDVLKVYQDKQGFIWICTRGGLSRYDGTRFTNYTTANGLTNDMINDIVEIGPAELLVAQNTGGPRLLKNNTILPILPNSTITINRFFPGKKGLLAATDDSGFMKFEGNNFSAVQFAGRQSIHDMAILNDSVWLMMQQLYGIQMISPSQQPLSPLLRLDATAVFTDTRKRTWVGTAHGLRLLAASPATGKPIGFASLPPLFDLPILKKAYINDMTEDSQGNYWIGTTTGLVEINKNGQAKIYAEQQGLPASSINCLREDRQKNLWIGTRLGLARLSITSEIKSYVPDFGLSHDGTSLISPVTEHNIRLFDGKNIFHLNLQSGKFTDSISVNAAGYHIYKPGKEQIMITKAAKAVIYKAGKAEPELIPWPDTTFDAVCRIDEHHFVASIANRLYEVFDGRLAEKIKVGVLSGVYGITAAGKNVVWAGTRDSGLFKIKVACTNRSLLMQTVDTFMKRLPDLHIRTLYADHENELWIGTRYKGVVRLHELPGGRFALENYGTQQGLSADFVLTISRDTKGNIWVGTTQGIDKLIPTQNHYRIFNFGKVNKIFSPMHDIFFLKDDYLLAAGSSIVYAKDTQQDTMPAPAVYITRVNTMVNDSMLNSYGKQRLLPHDKAQVDFEFSAPQFMNESFTRYCYRLRGSSDTTWTVAAKSNSVYYASLRSGDYIFEVKAMGLNGAWGQPATYAFSVNAPFWQKAWFILLVSAAAGILLYALYRYRVQQFIRLQRVRNQIAADLHDEIGSNLTNISILSTLGKKHILQPQKTQDFLHRISEEVSSSSQALDDIIWSVNSNHDTLEEIVIRMRRYAAELFDGSDTSCELYLDPAFEEKKLVMEQRRDIYMLYKEAVNNIFKHACAKHVDIKIWIEHGQLVFIIKDDGKGFNTITATGRHGLPGMKARVEKWNGKIQVESTEGNGTIIRCRFPLGG